MSPLRYKFACCDCALTHWMEFRIVKGHVQFAVNLNNRSTAAMRRVPQKCQSIDVWEKQLREKRKLTKIKSKPLRAKRVSPISARKR